jgi:hypothetical protein
VAGVVVGAVSVVVAEVVALAVVAEADADRSSSHCSVNRKPLEVGCMTQPTSAVFSPQRASLTEQFYAMESLRQFEALPLSHSLVLLPQKVLQVRRWQLP